MCGIVGIMRGTPTETMADMFEQLLYADVFRGPHSTGVFRTNKDGTATVLKEAVPASIYLSSQDWADFRGGTGTKTPALLSQVYVGHNRWATVGAINAENAHPFQCGNITMVHNGTVSKYRLHDHAKFEVDSHAVCNMINEKGLDETLKVLDGKFTLVYHDAKDNTMNFIRNSERPLGMVEFQDGSWAFASEMDMLSWINARRKAPIAVKRMFELPVGMHYKYSLADSKITLLEAVQKELPKYFPYSSANYGLYGSQSSTRSSSASSTSATSASMTQLDRQKLILTQYGFDIQEFNKEGTPAGTYWALDNVAFTMYTSGGATGRVDGELWGLDDALDDADQAGLKVDSVKLRHEGVIAVIYGVQHTLWKEVLSQSDNLYAKFDGVYESTINGKQFLQVTLTDLRTDLPAEYNQDFAVNEMGFPLNYIEEVVEGSDADKRTAGESTLPATAGGTGSTDGSVVSVPSNVVNLPAVVDDLEKLREKSEEAKKEATAAEVAAASPKKSDSSTLSKLKFNLSGVGATIDELKNDNLTCGWCGNSIHAGNYEKSDYFFRTLICPTCAKDVDTQ